MTAPWALLLVGCVQPEFSGGSAERVVWRPFPIFELPVGRGVPRDHLTVAATPTGDWMAAYEAIDTGTGEEQVLAVLHDDHGTQLRTADVFGTGRATHPQLVAVGHGFALCWDQQHNREIAAVRIGAAGRQLAPPTPLSVSAPGADRFHYCDLAAHSDGSLSAFWLARDHLQATPSGGQLWQGLLRPPRELPATLATYAQGPVALASRTDDTLVLAWTSPLVAGGPDQVQVATFDAAGGLLDGPFAVSDPALGVPNRPDVATALGGEVLVAWGAAGAAPLGPWTVQLTPSLQPTAPALNLCPQGGEAIALSQVGDYALASWVCRPVQGQLEVHLKVMDLGAGTSLLDEIVARPADNPLVRKLSVADAALDGRRLRGVVGWQQWSQRRSLFARAFVVDPAAP